MTNAVNISFNIYAAYGPGDQGAYNQFYEFEVRRDEIPEEFNAKPYWPFSSTAILVHFHGPKYSDYIKWAETGACRFGDMCKMGFTNGLCTYAEEMADVSFSELFLFGLGDCI